MIQIHSLEVCSGVCPVHAPSDHLMRDWPMLFRTDRYPVLTERTCPHGIGHPDPDSLAWIVSILGTDGQWHGIHGCDGCCRGIKM
jgi:hypothetical protein